MSNEPRHPWPDESRSSGSYRGVIRALVIIAALILGFVLFAALWFMGLI